MVWGDGYKMTEQEKRLRRCCFTGHRPQKLNRAESDIKRDLEDAIKSAISNGYSTFITGMAYGVDIWAGEIVVRLREANPDLHLIAAVPFSSFYKVVSSPKICYNTFKLIVEGETTMAVSYKKLWHILLDRDMKKKELAELAGLSPYTIKKMGRDEAVSTEVVGKICRALECNLDDVVEYIPTEENVKANQ